MGFYWVEAFNKILENLRLALHLTGFDVLVHI